MSAEPYSLAIKDGDPPEKERTVYPSKALFLSEVAEQIREGQHVEVSPGSVGKLKKLLEKRDFDT